MWEKCQKDKARQPVRKGETAGQTEEDQAGFRPIQSSSEELGPVPIRGWRTQYSGESDPNGYELDLGNISPPSDIEELSLGSVCGVSDELGASTAPAPITSQPQRSGSEAELQADAHSPLAEAHSPLADAHSPLAEAHSPLAEAHSPLAEAHSPLAKAHSPLADAHSPVTPAKDSQEFFHQSELKELSFDLNYEPPGPQSSYDPYGFKLSPEHSSHTLLDPDEAPSPSTSEPDLAYDPESPPPESPPPESPPPGFDPFASHACDPYGFKLSPDEINQEVIDFAASPANEENVVDFENKEQEDLNFSSRDVAEDEPPGFEDELLVDYENQEVLEPMRLVDVEDGTDPVEPVNQELLEFAPENQEVVDVFDHVDPVVEYENKEVLEPCSPALPDPRFHDALTTANQEVPSSEQSVNREEELVDFNSVENQEVVSGGHDNHMFHNQEVPDTDLDGNQEVLCKEANNNQPRSSSNSSDSDAEHTGVRPRGRGPEAGRRGVPGLQDGGLRGALLEGDLGEVFRQGGYVACPDVADDLEPLERRAASEPVRPLRPVRPPRPSLRAKEKSQGIDLK
ncbi:uncharacterized protein [Eucyclogobius newberryi]|uniref:uncharacterized protein n=1 Tax=Eucyclogobius newberryi TaxID=166745 RepID=UPI003B5CA4C5